MSNCGREPVRGEEDQNLLQARIKELESKVFAPDGVSWRQHALDIAKERPISGAFASQLIEASEARAQKAEGELERTREALKLVRANLLNIRECRARDFALDVISQALLPSEPEGGAND